MNIVFIFLLYSDFSTFFMIKISYGQTLPCCVPLQWILFQPWFFLTLSFALAPYPTRDVESDQALFVLSRIIGSWTVTSHRAALSVCILGCSLAVPQRLGPFIVPTSSLAPSPPPTHSLYLCSVSHLESGALIWRISLVASFLWQSGVRNSHLCRQWNARPVLLIPASDSESLRRSIWNRLIAWKVQGVRSFAVNITWSVASIIPFRLHH